MRLVWQGTLAVALTGAGLAWGQPVGKSSATPAAAPAATPAALAGTSETPTSDKLMLLREDGKDRKCLIEKTWKRPDGTTAYQVRVIGTNEVLTVTDGEPAKGETVSPPAPAPKRSMFGRMFHSDKPAAVGDVMPAGPPPEARSPAGKPGTPLPAPADGKSSDPLLNPEMSKVRIQGKESVTALPPAPAKSGGLFGRMHKADPPAPAIVPAATMPSETVPPPVLSPIPAGSPIDPQSRVGAGHADAVDLSAGRMAPAMMPMRMPAEAVQAAVVSPGPSPVHLMATLQEALGPSERERAVIALAQGPNNREPEVVAALLRAARTDPAATVRACCVHCLWHDLRCHDADFTAALAVLKADADPDVRHEAGLALARMK
jgi:hypothetical protein